MLEPVLDWQGKKLPIGPWSYENKEETWEDNMTGYQCYLRRNSFYAWCAYVAVPSYHALFEAKQEDVPSDILKLGGILSYGRAERIDPQVPKAWYFAFDCMNGPGDLTPGSKVFAYNGELQQYRTTEWAIDKVEKLCRLLKNYEAAGTSLKDWCEKNPGKKLEGQMCLSDFGDVTHGPYEIFEEVLRQNCINTCDIDMLGDPLKYDVVFSVDYSYDTPVVKLEKAEYSVAEETDRYIQKLRSFVPANTDENGFVNGEWVDQLFDEFRSIIKRHLKK